MKKFEKVMAAAAMIFLIIALLLTSFQVAIYIDSMRENMKNME